MATAVNPIPITGNFITYFRDMSNSLDGVDTLTDLSSTMASLLSRFSFPEEALATISRVGDASDLINDGLAPFSFVSDSIGLAQDIGKGEWASVTKDTFGLAVDTTKTIRLVNTTKLLSFSENVMSGVQTVFWGGVGVLSSWEFVDNVLDANSHRDKALRAKTTAGRDLHEGLVDVANLKSLSNISVVGMAAISIISIIFASLLTGAAAVLSAVFLGCSLVYITLKIASYFYERTIRDDHALAIYSKA